MFCFPNHWLYRMHRRRHHPKAPMATCLSSNIILNLENLTMQVNLTWTTPTLRADDTTALALTDIKQINLNRNGVLLANPTPILATMAFSDTTPLSGADSYDVEYVDQQGFISKPSNTVSVTVAAANPPAAVTDLAATLITP